MPNLSNILKTEITRLARKESKALVEPLRKIQANQRREIAELKRQVAELRKSGRRATTPERSVADSKSTIQNTEVRFSAKGLKSLRAKLGVSATQLGKLAGASGQSVYNWEAGKTMPRASQRSKLAELRGIGKREATPRLEEM